MAPNQTTKSPKPNNLIDWLDIEYALLLWLERPATVGGVIGAFLALLYITSLVAGLIIAFILIKNALWLPPNPASNSAGLNLGTGGLIIALLGSPFLLWNTFIKQKSLDFQKQGHFTDRIAKAVEQLGADKVVKAVDAQGEPIERTAPNIEVRIGGIYSLERIAQDSMTYDYGRDHIQIMEILCAYVRENAPAKDLEPTKPPFTTKTPRIDIQTAMNVIKRRKIEQVAAEASARYRLDLRGTDLDGCDLRDGKFAGAIFARSRLEATSFRDADLTGARLHRCLINFTDFNEATLFGANLDNCVSSPSDNSGRFLTSSAVMGVSIIGAELTGLDSLQGKGPFLFGNKDTKLAPNLEETRQGLNHLKSKLSIAEKQGDAAAVQSLKSQIAQTGIGHWIPYSMSDGELNHERKKFHDRLGITGWPHTDT